MGHRSATISLVVLPTFGQVGPPLGTEVSLRCEAQTGFLTHMRCDDEAEVKCVPCRRNICKPHSRNSAAGLLCISCHMKRAETRRSPGLDDLSKTDYDPYLYAAYFYKSYDYEPFAFEEPEPAGDPKSDS